MHQTDLETSNIGKDTENVFTLSKKSSLFPGLQALLDCFELKHNNNM